MHVADLPPRINDPEALRWTWLALGLILVALAVLLPLLVRWLRRRADRRWAIRAAEVSGLERLRRDYLARLDVLDQDWGAGRVDDADGNSRVSVLLRGFVGIATDTDADFMTLSELRAACPQHPSLQAALDVLEPSYSERFRPSPRLPARDDAVAAAREVIRQWR